MRKVNTNELEPLTWQSPSGKYRGSGVEISEALGRKPDSTDILERHPFDVEILRIPPGFAPYSYHAHSAQWEFYHIISGSGSVRAQDGRTAVRAGDALLFPPRHAHQLINDGTEEMVVYVVADNPYGESTYFPDSDKVRVGLPTRASYRRTTEVDYFEGEDDPA